MIERMILWLTVAGRLLAALALVGLLLAEAIAPPLDEPLAACRLVLRRFVW